jgi:hypothetical protein
MKSSTWKTQLEEVMKKKPYEPLKLKGKTGGINLRFPAQSEPR